MRQVSRQQPRDPAPSKLSYRFQRLLLTPLFRGFLRVGLPMVTAAGIGMFVLSNQGIRDRIGLTVTEFRRSFEERPEFSVRLMSIQGASPEISEDIREIVPIDFPVSSFDLNLAGIKDTVVSLDAVETVDVRVRSGGVLLIDVQERVPAVVWRGPQGVEMLDTGGHRVGPLVARAERPDLPLITGRGAKEAIAEALELFAAAAPIIDRTRGLVRIGERRWDVVLDRGQRILLPENDAVAALGRIIALDQAKDLLRRDLAAVDMRNPLRPTIRLQSDAVAELRQTTGQAEGDPGQ